MSNNIPADLQLHQVPRVGARLAADGNVEVGITDHAQDALGDLVFVEAPEAGKTAQGGRRLRGGRVGEGRLRRVRTDRGQSWSRAMPRSAASPS